MKHAWIEELAQVVMGIRNKQEMIEFFHGLFTDGELEEVTRRLQIVKKLKAGVPQHEIAKELGVGVATVTRGSKELQRGRFKNVVSSR